MEEYKTEREYGPIIAIIVILLVLFFSAYIIFSSAFQSSDKIIIQKDEKEIYININESENKIDLSEVDIEEISRRLNELDINLDDILKDLDI